MSDSLVIPKDIRRFLLENIDSIAQLEGLLLLRSNPQQEWTVEIISQRLYINEKEVIQLLDKLCGVGLLVASRDKPVLYKYNPASLELHQAVESTALVYSQYLLAVTHLIHDKRKTRIQEFADAFLIRRE